MDVVYNLLGVDKASDALRRVETAMGGVGKTWTRLAGVLGAGGSIAYLTHLVAGAIEAGDRMNDLSQIMGVSVGTLSGLQVAAKVAGVDMELLARALGRLSKALVDSDDETKGAAEALAALGIRAQEFVRLSVEQRLFALAEAFARSEDGGAKAAAAMSLFGNQVGQAMIPFLNQGAEGLRELMALAEALGLTLDSKTAASMDAVADALALMRMQTQGVGNQIAIALLPLLEGLSKLWLDNARQGNSFGRVMADVVTGALKVVATVGIGVWAVLRRVGTVLGAVMAAATLAVQGNFAGAWETLKAGIADAGTIAADTERTLRQLWTDTLPGLTDQEKALAAAINFKTESMRKAAEAAERDYARALGVVNELLARAIGVQGDYAEKLRQVQLWYSRNREKTEEYHEALRALVLQQPWVVEHLKRQAEAFDAAFDAQEKERLAIEGRIRSAREMVENMEFEAAALRLSNREREVAIRLRELERLGIERGSAAYEAFAKRIRDAVDSKQAAEANIEANKRLADEWRRTSQVIEQSLTDALMRGFESGKDFGRNFRDALVNMFKTLVLRPIIQPIAQAGAGAILGLLGMGGPGLANAATGGVGAGLLGGLGMGAGLGSFFATGLMNTLVGTGTLSGLSAAGSLISGGNLLGGVGMGLGAIAPWAAGAYALYSIIRGNRRSPAQQNYSVLSGTGASLAGTAFDPYAAFSPHLQSGAAFDEALRRTIAGVSATALALGGTPSLDLRYGLFSSVSPNGRGGYTSSELRGPGGQVLYNFGINGPNDTVDARLQQQISALFLAGLQASDLPQDIAAYLSQFSPQSITQEQLNTIMAAATAARTMAEAVRGLGGSLEAVAGLSVEARLQLAEFAGGFDNFAQQLRGFVEQYYSRDEIAGLRAREIRDLLAGVGITQDISTREQFRALVESLDVSGEQGRRQLAALLGVSGSFAGLADYLAESGGTLQSAAGGAPDLGALGSALASSGQQQVQATIGVVERLVETNGLLARILDRIGDTRIVIQAPSALEVGTIGGGN